MTFIARDDDATILSRRERDAIVGLITVFASSFLAGLLSTTTASGTVVYAYSAANGLLLIAFAAYLIYRAVAGVARWALARYRGSQGAESS